LQISVEGNPAIGLTLLIEGNEPTKKTERIRMKNKPSSLEEVCDAAADMFRGNSIASVIVESTFGNLEIRRCELYSYDGYADDGSED
jgi:hypothetical protein